LEANAELLKDAIANATANIASNATTLFEKLDSFLSNLKDQLISGVAGLSTEVQADLVDAVSTIKDFVEEEADEVEAALESAYQAMQEAAAELKTKVAAIKKLLIDGLKNISSAINETLFFKLTTIAKQIQSAIQKVNNTLTAGGQAVESALEDVADNLTSDVVSFTEVLTDLLQTGASGLGSLGSSLLSGLSAAATFIGKALTSILSATVDISVNANVNGTA